VIDFNTNINIEYVDTEQKCTFYKCKILTNDISFPVTIINIRGNTHKKITVQSRTLKLIITDHGGYSLYK